MKFHVAFILLVMSGCTQSSIDPQSIVDQAIEKAGGEKFTKCTIEFDFRDRHYVTRRRGGIFSHERIFKSSGDTVHDYLTNDGFYREINNSRVSVPDSMAVKYSNSVNSTIYFALLPYGLNDSAVKKKFLRKTILDNEPYYVIEITFDQQGGGNDYTDVFLYWIHEKNLVVDYLAYLYYTDGGGIRFRKAFNPRMVNGVLFQDYINYQPRADSAKIDDVESLYKRNDLKELSRIELTNITVRLED
jgi:hypothetical protein